MRGRASAPGCLAGFHLDSAAVGAASTPTAPAFPNITLDLASRTAP